MIINSTLFLLIFNGIEDEIDFSYWKPGMGHIYELRTKTFSDPKPLKFVDPSGRKGFIIPNYYTQIKQKNLVLTEETFPKLQFSKH